MPTNTMLIVYISTYKNHNWIKCIQFRKKKQMLGKNDVYVFFKYIWFPAVCLCMECLHQISHEINQMMEVSSASCFIRNTSCTLLRYFLLSSQTDIYFSFHKWKIVMYLHFGCHFNFTANMIIRGKIFGMKTSMNFMYKCYRL